MLKCFAALLLPLSLMAQAELEPRTMLYQADVVSKLHNFEVAKAPPPSQTPQAQNCLDTASVWFSLDLNEIAAPAFDTLNNDSFWDYLREIGVQGVYLKGLKQGGEFRTGIALDPKWGNSWAELTKMIQRKGIALIGDSIGSSTGLSADFCLALKNYGDYPGLYHLVEIHPNDWKMLPCIGPAEFTTNIPWLTLQELQKKGYVPEHFSPYVKESRWNATSPIQGTDGKMRRWIYLKENECDPMIDWLNPSFAGCRIATADTLDSVYNLGQKITRLDAEISSNAKETLTLWARKLGTFSVLETKGGIAELKRATSDLMTDTLTRSALLHALIAEDAEALKLIYRLYLCEEIQTKRLVHSLQTFDKHSCDWAEFLLNPRKKYKYYEDILTGEALRMRLLKEDTTRVGETRPVTWPIVCPTSTGIKEYEKQSDQIAETHLLLTLFYAMQPGAFSFSLSDLLGTLQPQPVNIMGTNENTIYASLPGQMKNPKSFAMQLRNILDVRRGHAIESGELICVPETTQRGLLVLVHRLRGNRMLQLLAINFGKTSASQTLEIPEIAQTTAIDLMTGLAEKKPLESTEIRLELPPLTGKVILFQTKYYD